MDVWNLILFLFGLFNVCIAFYSIWRCKLRSYNLYFVIFYLGLTFNCLKLSIFQTDKTFVDLYYFGVGPLAFTFILFLFEHLPKLKTDVKYSLVNLDFLYICLLIGFLGLKLYIVSVVGLRIESLFYSTFLVSGEEYSIPGISGLVGILQWMLLIFSPYVKKKYVVIAFVGIIVFAVLHVKRGDILRLFSFLLCYFVYKQIYLSGLLNKKMLKYVCLGLLVFLSFVLLGNLRQEARGGGSDSLSNNIGIKDASPALSWVYGYVAINYDVVRAYFDEIPTQKPTVVEQLFSGSDADSEPESGINGFNASTFISQFIKDFGVFYFIEMVVFALILGILIYIIRSINFLGCYVFILSLLLFAFFGNYLANRSIFFALLLSIFFFSLASENRKRVVWD
ncbi:hypothetical protein [Dysgonomonas macrotermitis]|uniref:Oligosaccharide repeat unit polymerase n=1 Tax=Dysgonomonas macrotermitis TaxID=1346286 RepID=A0A1M5I458_9BACT|nr:hypothetical protein [Dysgonomonas macrotermitis]SHG23032.1 hypothetical protein SAMN05444362_11834 [Dysgonomonas macrotermitis]